jgi:hypothetical protein
MFKFQNPLRKLDEAVDRKLSDKAVDRFYSVSNIAYKTAMVGTTAILGAAAVIAAGVAIDKSRNPQDYDNN